MKAKEPSDACPELVPGARIIMSEAGSKEFFKVPPELIHRIVSHPGELW